MVYVSFGVKSMCVEEDPLPQSCTVAIAPILLVFRALSHCTTQDSALIVCELWLVGIVRVIRMRMIAYCV